MEFDKPSTKYTFIAIVSVALIDFGFLCFKMIQYDLQTSNELAQEKQDCENLNAHYGDTFYLKDGHYTGIKMKAVDFGLRSIGLSTPETGILKFRCGDVQRTLPKKFQTEPESKRVTALLFNTTTLVGSRGLARCLKCLRMYSSCLADLQNTNRTELDNAINTRPSCEILVDLCTHAHGCDK